MFSLHIFVGCSCKLENEEYTSLAAAVGPKQDITQDPSRTSPIVGQVQHMQSIYYMMNVSYFVVN
jgi:hypothetical protein